MDDIPTISLGIYLVGLLILVGAVAMLNGWRPWRRP